MWWWNDCSSILLSDFCILNKKNLIQIDSKITRIFGFKKVCRSLKIFLFDVHNRFCFRAERNLIGDSSSKNTFKLLSKSWNGLIDSLLELRKPI